MNAQNQNITSLSVHVNRAAVQTASIGQAIPLRSHLFQAQDRPSLTPPWLTSHSHNNIMWPPTWTGSDDARCVSVVNINSIFVVRLTLSAPFYETGGEWIKKLFERLVEGGIFYSTAYIWPRNYMWILIQYLILHTVGHQTLTEHALWN